ncbi:MAG: hypothetical protein HN348_27195 [Proteobacteria bacterium]|jgi:predicted type IV restriction endonuclease|nr:hypothetical protein [Pseudomonadota bacterium]
MDTIDSLRQLAAELPARLPLLQSESATRNGLVLPFLQALGYNVFDPNQVRVDNETDVFVYAQGKPSLRVLVRKPGSQLLRSEEAVYATFGEAKLAILTDGIKYLFYVSLDELDEAHAPSLTFDLSDFDDAVALEPFVQHRFEPDQAVVALATRKYVNGIKTALTAELASPKEDLIRLLTGRVFSGRMTQNVRERFAPYVHQALNEFVADQVLQTFEVGLASVMGSLKEPEPTPEIVTTEEEILCYNIVKAILWQVTDGERVTIRDTKSYCGVLLDDNNRKPLCRLRFNYAQKNLGLFSPDKTETRVPIDSPAKIYDYADHLRATAIFYDTGSWPAGFIETPVSPEVEVQLELEAIAETPSEE